MSIPTMFPLASEFHYNTATGRVNLNIDTNIQFKMYPNSKAIPLDMSWEGLKKQNNKDYEDVLMARVSTRAFLDEAIEFETLSKLLSISCGVRSNCQEYQFRTYASAGGRFPIEVYLVMQKSDELELGVYHYNVYNNTLELVKKGNYSSQLKKFYSNQPFDLSVPCIILLSSLFHRTMMKYGERGYRYTLIDAGHIGQNLYLTASYLNLGIVGLGGGAEDDMVLDELLGLYSKDESIIYGFALGHK